MAWQMFLDLYGCDRDILDDVEKIKSISHIAVDGLGAQIVEECMHKFEPIGVTYVAVITTSHFSIHTWPENNYAAVDIFSCKEEVPQELASLLEEAFAAKSSKINVVQRYIGG